MRTSMNITDIGEKEAREDFGKLMLSRDLPMNFFWVEMYTKMAQNKNTILVYFIPSTDYYVWQYIVTRNNLYHVH